MRVLQTTDGAMTGKKFLAYVERRLAPTLKRKDIVTIDNLPAHKAVGDTARPGQRIEARGETLHTAQVFAGPQSDQMPFNKLKADLRKAAVC